jgi:hypothetical protein
MSPSHDDQLEEWQNAIDDIHGEIDLEDPMLDIEVDDSAPGDDMEVTEVSITRPMIVGEGEEPIEVTRRLDRADGGQIAVTVRKHFRCPSCHYFPQYDLDEYDQPPELKGWCRDCDTLTCTECEVKCSLCERDLCSDCSEAFITEDGPLCEEHRHEAKEHRDYQRQIEAREQDRKDRELELKYELRFLELELEARIKEQQQRLQAYIERWKQIDRITKNQIQKKKLELEHMLKRRKQALDEFESAAEVELRREKQEMEREQHRDRMDFQREKHRDQHRLAERKQTMQEQSEEFDQYIKEEKLKLKQAEALLRARNSDPEKTVRCIKKATKKLNGMKTTPAITV